jgi:hypothetical protein
MTPLRGFAGNSVLEKKIEKNCPADLHDKKA